MTQLNEFMSVVVSTSVLRVRNLPVLRAAIVAPTTVESRAGTSSTFERLNSTVMNAVVVSF